MNNLLYKKFFTIQDLALIVKKETQTIRSWERKGIIKKPNKNPYNNWRQYSRVEMLETLEKILNYSWERKIIKNTDEIKYIVDFLRNNIQVNYD